MPTNNGLEMTPPKSKITVLIITRASYDAAPVGDEDERDRGDDEAIPAEELEAVLVQVADEPAHRDDRGDERGDEADERVHPPVRVDELAAVLQRLERGRRAQRQRARAGS